ncbi:MAG: thiamine-phosphate kinase [Rhodospirillaceae bacterium]
MAHRVDEFTLIQRHFAPLSVGAPGSLALRDDAAWLRAEAGNDLVVSADAIVGDVHFPANTSAGDIARRALRVNLSDIAAKGARACAYTLALQLPDFVDDAWLSAFAAGLAEDQDRFGIFLLGGDTTRTPGPLALTVNIFGQVSDNEMIVRSGASEGDDVYVTGSIGDATLGLALVRSELRAVDPSDTAFLEARFLRPNPRVDAGPALVGIASAAADVSDGLVADLGHICAASGVAADIDRDRVPHSDAAHRLVTDDQPLRARLLTGGDDYEIVFTAPEVARDSISAIAANTGVPMTRIGRVTPQTADGPAVTVRDAAGGAIEVGHGGYRHFEEGDPRRE